MAGGKQEAGNEKESEDTFCDEEVWAVEVLESVGTKGNIDTFTLAVENMTSAECKGKRISIKLVNVTTMVPCGLGSSLPLSQVDKGAIKAHELRMFKLLITPLLTCPASKKVKPKYVPVRNDKRVEGIIQVANKIRASRFYLPIKKASNLVGRLALEMPGGCIVIGVLGGKKIAECEAQRVDMFDSQDTRPTINDSGRFDGDASEYSISSIGESMRLQLSMSTSLRSSSYEVTNGNSPPLSRRDSMVGGGGSPQLLRRNSMFQEGSSPDNHGEYSATTPFGQSPSTRGAPLRQMSYTSSALADESRSLQFPLRRGTSDANEVVNQSNSCNHIPVMAMLRTSADTPSRQQHHSGLASCLPTATEIPSHGSVFSSPSPRSTNSGSLEKGSSGSYKQGEESGIGPRSLSTKTSEQGMGQRSPSFGVSVSQKIQSFAVRMIAEKRSGNAKQQQGKERSLSRMGSGGEKVDPSIERMSGRAASSGAISLRK